MVFCLFGGVVCFGAGFFPLLLFDFVVFFWFDFLFCFFF